jgi:hypothetical protein
VTILITERLIFRRWRQSDLEPFARMNQDRRVMEFMPALLSPRESDLLVDRIKAHFREQGFGLCAVELRQHGYTIQPMISATPDFQKATVSGATSFTGYSLQNGRVNLLRASRTAEPYTHLVTVRRHWSKFRPRRRLPRSGKT